MAPISQGAAQLCVDRCQANAERLVAGQRVSAEHIFLRRNWSRNWTESTGVILGEAFFCYLKSIMYLDFPTLPSCNTVCLSFSCQAKLHVSYDCCDLWYVWTRQMKCYLQSHLKILDRCLHLVPHPSCPLSEVQFVALCHLSWRGTRNHNNTNQQINNHQLASWELRYHSEEYASNKLSWTPYMVVERGSWAQLVSSALLLLPILWEPTDMLNLQTSIVRPCLDPIKVPSFFTLSPSHQFLAACMEY